MLSILLFCLVGMALWTGLSLFRKGPNQNEIKTVLKEMGNNAFGLLDVSLKIFDNFKNLFSLLNQQDIENKANQTQEIKEESPKLISIQENKVDKAA